MPPTRVLVVDDAPGDARLVQLTLEDEPGGPFPSERAPTIRAAVERIARGQLEAVLLDMNLPDSTGLDGLRRIRTAAPDLAVVALSGSDDPERVRAALEEGAQDYLVKGVLPRGVLGTAIAVAVARQRLLTALDRAPAEIEPAFQGLDRLGVGAAMFEGGHLHRCNDRYRELVGSTPAGADRPPEWWTDGGQPPADAPNGPTPGSPARSHPAIRVGRIDPTQGHGPLAYTASRTGTGPPGGLLVFLRELVPARSTEGVRPRSPSIRAPPTTGPHDPDPVDAEAWQRLQELGGGDPAFLGEIVRQFRLEGAAGFARLDQAVGAGDAVAVERAAHGLKSSCAQVGGVALSHRLGELERRASRGEVRDLGPDAVRAREEFARLTAALASRTRPAPTRPEGPQNDGVPG